MLLDLTLPITPRLWQEAKTLNDPALEGHLGTHFDVMEQVFPLEFTRRKGIVFDVSRRQGEEITLEEEELARIEAGMFVGFFGDYGEKVGYGNPGYFSAHPVLSYELIEALLSKNISVIGLDFAGIRRTPEHIPADRRCAEQGVFVVENLVNLQDLVGKSFTAHIYPMALKGVTGLPCRVIAEL